jgi:VanZ family protein
MALKAGLHRHWPAIAWGALILLLTGLPGQYIPRIEGFPDLLAPDNLAHLFLFTGFVIFLLIGFAREPGWSCRKSAILAFTIAVGVGGLTEFLQEWVFVNRTCSIWDFCIDFMGTVIGMLLYRIGKGFFLRVARDH